MILIFGPIEIFLTALYQLDRGYGNRDATDLNRSTRSDDIFVAPYTGHLRHYIEFFKYFVIKTPEN